MRGKASVSKHDWHSGWRASFASTGSVSVLFISLSVYQIYVHSLNRLDLFTTRPGGGPLGLLLANAVYDGETNVIAIVLSSAYLAYLILELAPSKRRLAAVAYPVTLTLVPLIVDIIYVSVGVGLFCRLPCTSEGMSVVATTSMGFVFILSFGGLANVIREFWKLSISRIAGLISSLLFLGYLIAFLLLLLGAFVSQDIGVIYVHYAGLGLGAVVGFAIVSLYRPQRE
jgi:hypothetical protein